MMNQSMAPVFGVRCPCGFTMQSTDEKTAIASLTEHACRMSRKGTGTPHLGAFYLEAWMDRDDGTNYEILCSHRSCNYVREVTGNDLTLDFLITEFSKARVEHDGS